MSHLPVLMAEVLSALKPQGGEVYIDGTFGAGGYTKAVLGAANCNVIGLDRDPNVQVHVDELGQQFPERFSFVMAEFSNMEEAVGGRLVDGVILDIGVSSMQLDQAGRGFSFMREGPLDMRMAQAGASAADVIKHFKHNELIEIFRVYGEERRARRCADFIVRARDILPIETTDALADVIIKALGKGGKKHPATKIFQALRIYVNDELRELQRALLAAEKILNPGGRLVVVSFHSLEDRMVKLFLRARCGDNVSGSRHLPPQHINTTKPSFDLPKRSGVSAGREEQIDNPRSRSAHLRCGVRTGADIWPVKYGDNNGLSLIHI